MFSMGEGDQNCDTEIQKGILPKYSVVAVKI
jgi:hypothetical protein